MSDADSSAPNSALADLLTRLDRALDRMTVLPELDEARFLETHVLYEGRSDQQTQIVDWFTTEISPTVPHEGVYRVLSVGCGSGILDVPVARSFAAQGSTLRYVGVDPNAVECDAFVKRFAASGVPGDLEVVDSAFEEFVSAERFDAVLIVHSLYYFPDPADALARARKLLAPGGRLVVFHAPRGVLNRLAARFYDKTYGRPTLFAEEVAALCEHRGWKFQRNRIDAHLDASPYLGSPRDAEVGTMLRDFLVQVDSRRLPPSVQTLIDAYLDLAALRSPDSGRAFLPHPVDVFELSR